MLTLNDRCDSCKAAAAVRAIRDDLELLFCQHHARKHSVMLNAQGFQLVGELDFDLVRS